MFVRNELRSYFVSLQRRLVRWLHREKLSRLLEVSLNGSWSSKGGANEERGSGVGSPLDSLHGYRSGGDRRDGEAFSLSSSPPRGRGSPAFAPCRLRLGSVAQVRLIDWSSIPV